MAKTRDIRALAREVGQLEQQLDSKRRERDRDVNRYRVDLVLDELGAAPGSAAELSARLAAHHILLPEDEIAAVLDELVGAHMVAAEGATFALRKPEVSTRHLHDAAT